MCECLNMMYRGADDYLICLNERCQHFQVKYDAPVYVELKLIGKKIKHQTLADTALKYEPKLMKDSLYD